MTKEELRKEFEDATGITIPMANTFEYSQWLEKKLIDQSQEPKQREEYCKCENRQDQFTRGDKWVCGDCDEEIKQREPKQTEVSEDKINDIDKLILKWLNSKSENTTQLSFDIVQYFNSMKEREQREVSEDLQYQNLTCLVHGFELNTYQKGLAKQEYKKLLSMKERESVEFTEWCVRNANPLFPNSNTWKHKGGEYSTQELFDLFKSKTKK
jgi:hypothetical protein